MKSWPAYERPQELRPQKVINSSLPLWVKVAGEHLSVALSLLIWISLFLTLPSSNFNGQLVVSYDKLFNLLLFSLLLFIKESLKLITILQRKKK